MLQIARTPFSPDSDREPNIAKMLLERFESGLSAPPASGTASWSIGTIHIMGSLLDVTMQVQITNDPFLTQTSQLSAIEARMCSLAPIETLTQFTWCAPTEEALEYDCTSDVNVLVGVGGFFSKSKLPSLSSYARTIDWYCNVTADDDLVEKENLSDAVSLTDELKAFLGGISDQQLGDILGVGRTTLIAWRMNRHEARPSKIASVLAFHALVIGLRRALGDVGARTWLFSENRLEQLTSSVTRDEVVRAANRIIYANAPRTWEPPFLANDRAPQEP